MSAAKLADLTRANNDMNNLLAGTGIGTVFVDHQLRILRFTPAATRIINLIAGDVGRPVGHLVSNLVGYEQLVADVQEVLDTLVTKEREVQTVDGRWYTMRIQLYRTLDNVIEGAVLTFVDITDMKKIRAALQESESLFRELAASLPQLLWMCRPDGLYDYLSPQWIQYTGIPEAHRLGSSWLDQVHPEDRGALKVAWDTAVATGEPFTAEFRLRHHDGDFKWFDTRVTPLRNPAGQIVKWFGLSRGIPGPMPGGSSAQGTVARRRESREVPDEQEA